jgi:hypothetical protein
MKNPRVTAVDVTDTDFLQLKAQKTSIKEAIRLMDKMNLQNQSMEWLTDRAKWRKKALALLGIEQGPSLKMLEKLVRQPMETETNNGG